MADRTVNDNERIRCPWATGGDPLYTGYHDDEWGRPVIDDIALFEKLCLEGFQAGLSWITILRKRPAFRAAFAGFDPAAIATFDDDDIARLLGDAGIVRHRGKISATINNAQRYRELSEEFGSLAAYAWTYEPAISAAPRELTQLPSITPESTEMSRDLKRRGWRFVGPTTVYAFMQAMGLVNDHLQACWARPACEAERSALQRPARPS